VQYHTALNPTEIQFNSILKQAATRLGKNGLSSQMSIVAIRKPKFLVFDVTLGRFE